MEDSYTMENLPSGVGMCAVFDGHGGEEVANFSAKHLSDRYINIKL